MRFFKCLVTGSLKQSVKKRDLREKNYYYSPCYCYPTTCPLLKKDSSNSCRRKTGTPTDEEDEVKILNLDSRCPARAVLP